jgi:hypothetical protein
LIEHPGQEKQYSRLFCDIFYRPEELAHMYAWEIFQHYEKSCIPTSGSYLQFKEGHPQYRTHCLKKLDTPVIPVFMGYRIPRNDSEADRQKYAVVILTLFRAWLGNKESPLKKETESWEEALSQMLEMISPEHKCILRNMQLLYQTQHAKFDYSAKRQKRLHELKLVAANRGISFDNHEDVYNPIWESAMQTMVDPDIESSDVMLVIENSITKKAEQIVTQASRAGFYQVGSMLDPELVEQITGNVTCGNDDDRVQADADIQRIAKEKEHQIQQHLHAAQTSAIATSQGECLLISNHHHRLRRRRHNTPYNRSTSSSMRSNYQNPNQLNSAPFLLNNGTPCGLL